MKNRKFYYQLAGMLVITVFAVGSIFYLTFFRSSLMSEAEMHLNEITIQTAARIEQKLSSNMELMNTLAYEARDFDSHAEAENIARLKGWTEKNIFTEIAFADENGKGYSSEGEKISLVSSELYDQISRTGSGMSPVIRDFREKYSNVIIFSSPVIENGRYEGIIYGVFEIQNISRAIELEFFDGAGHGFLLDYWGNILVHPKKEMVGKNMFLELSRNNSSVDTQRLKSKFLSAEPGNGVYTYGGIKYYVSSVHLKDKYGMRSAEPQGGISVIMAAPYNMVFEHSTIIIRQVRGLFVLTFILFCMIIAYILYQKKENEASLRKAAYEDDLCNVLNRKGFGRSAALMLEDSGSRLAAIYADIDNFKIINGIFGYEFGDSVLKAMASELKKAFGKDAVIGRISADNFQILVPYSNINTVFRKIDKVAQAMKKRFAGHKEVLISAGIYFVEDRTEESEQIFDKAQLAGKRVKYVSRTPYEIYEESFTDDIKKENWLTEEIKKAVENSDFEIYYQPKFEIETERIVATEALIRWNHREVGFISPAEFIPLAEKTQQIVDIGRFVFDQVCRDMAQWREKGLEMLPVSVNLSRVELYQADIVDYIKGCIAAHEIEPELMQVEVTETVAVYEYEGIHEVLLEINALGISISIDDFGSGYSSLACLHKFNVDTLKLDRSFLVNIEIDKKGINILRGMIELSRELGLSTVCEGIETREQLEMLRDMKCKYGQGFVFARPMPLADLEIFVEKNQKSNHEKSEVNEFNI